MTTPQAVDSLERIRKALEAGPTEGEWHVARPTYKSLPHIRNDSGRYVMDAPSRREGIHGHVRQDADAKFIAACNPVAIRSLLAREAALREALEAAREHIDFMRGLEKSVLAIELQSETLATIDAALDSTEPTKD